MTKGVHVIYITIMVLIVILSFSAIVYFGNSYYGTSLEERFFHENHRILEPKGMLGHGLGIIGSLLMIIGVSSYMARKRYRFLSRLGLLKHWLEFHIFLCTLGPVLVLFHTAFKFGGLVAVSFWSMVAVFLSGIIGRFIYIQIPRSIEGRELSLNEVRDMKSDIGGIIHDSYNLDKESYNVIVESTKKTGDYSNTLSQVKKVLKRNKLSKEQYKSVLKSVKDEISLNRRISRLVMMQNLFKYWHVAHLPFALVMLIIMIIHIGVTVTFGFRWIF
jgi:hypothetical protein